MSTIAHAAAAPAADRTNWCFALGRQAYMRGDAECPFLPGSTAARQWRAGWDDEAEYARCADLRAQAEFDANYCPPE